MQGRKDVFRRIERQYFRDRMSELGLSTVEGMLVRALGQQGETRQEDLVVNMVLDKGAVARAMAHLEQLDLVQRTVSGQCRREKLGSLTAAGAEKASRSPPARNLQFFSFIRFSANCRRPYRSTAGFPVCKPPAFVGHACPASMSF